MCIPGNRGGPGFCGAPSNRASASRSAAVSAAPPAEKKIIAEQGFPFTQVPAVFVVGGKVGFFSIGITPVERLRIRLRRGEDVSGIAQTLIAVRFADAFSMRMWSGCPGHRLTHSLSSTVCCLGSGVVIR
jgi:hypothetical protein